MNIQPILNKKTVVLLSTIAVISTFLLPIGSAAKQNFHNGGNYTIDIVPDRTATIRSVRVTDKGGKLSISGRIIAKRPSAKYAPNYIKIDLIGSDGRQIDSRKVAYYPSRIKPRNMRHRSHLRKGRFWSTFDERPPAGSTIRLENLN